jgi:hypothetical protein
VPVYRSRTVIEVARNLRAFLNLDLGLVRGEVPDPDQDHRRLGELQRELERARKRLSDRDRRPERMRELAPGEGRPAPAPRSGRKARARNRTRRERKPGQTIVGDPREHFIGRVVKERSFADVGGLRGVVGEKVSLAHSHGAAALTMIDAAPEDDGSWRAFADRMRYFGVPAYETVRAGVIDLAGSPDHPRYDVVHCADGLHRVPDPLRFLSALRGIAREYLVLSSAVTTASIGADGETLELPSTASIFVPALGERERAILEDHRRPVGSDSPKREQEFSDAQDLASWWWLPTVGSMRAMCESAGFSYEDGAHYWNDNAYVMLLSQRP